MCIYVCIMYIYMYISFAIYHIIFFFRSNPYKIKTWQNFPNTTTLLGKNRLHIVFRLFINIMKKFFEQTKI